MNYRYFKFTGGKFFRTIDEISFEVLNNNYWEKDNMIYFLYEDVGVQYEEITDEEIINKLENFPKLAKGEIKK